MTDEEKAAQAAAETAALEAKEAEALEAKEKAEKEAAEAKEKSKEKPTDGEAALLKELMGLKEKFKKAEAEKAEKEKLLATYEGVDPDKAKLALQAQKEAERKALEDKGEYQRIIEGINKEHEDKLTAVSTEKSTLKETIDNLTAQVNRLTVGNSFGSSKFIQDAIVLSPAKAEALYSQHFDITENGLVAYDKPRGSQERTKLVDSTGSPLSFEAAIEKVVKSDPDWEMIAKSHMKSGASSTNKDTPGNKSKDNNVLGVDRIRAGLEALSKK